MNEKMVNKCEIEAEVNQKKNSGFTIVELIVVVAIMAVLVSVLSLGCIRYIRKAQKMKDRTTANHIYDAFINAAIEFPEAYAIIDDFRAKYKTDTKHLMRTVTVTVDGKTEAYNVILFAASENSYFTGTQKELVGKGGFYDTVNEELRLWTDKNKKNKSMLPCYKVKRKGDHPADGEDGKARQFQTVDRWRVVIRVDNGDFEVWSADGTRYGGWPQFRVYPDPDDEYR